MKVIIKEGSNVHNVFLLWVAIYSSVYRKPTTQGSFVVGGKALNYDEVNLVKSIDIIGYRRQNYQHGVSRIFVFYVEENIFLVSNSLHISGSIELL